MNATPNKFAIFAEEDDLGQFSGIPNESVRGGRAEPSTPSRKTSRDAIGGTAFSIRPFALSTESPIAAPQESLAIGVLSQAAHDLRRFHAAISGVERELYLDAYSWVTTNDFSWSYSFINVCALLHASPDTMRAELLADASLGWFGHWIKLGERLSRLLRASFIRVFAKSREIHNPQSDQSARTLQRL